MNSLEPATENRRQSPPARTDRQRRRGWLPTYERLLELAYHWQYIDRDMIRLIEPQLVNSVRTLQDQLQGLVLMGFLKTTPRTSPRELHLYSITPKGVRELRELKGDWSLLITSHNVINPLFVDHARAISWFQTHVELAVRARDDLTVLLYERRYHHDERRLGTGSWVPDFGFVLARRLPDGQVKVVLYLVEVDRGRMAPKTIYEKLRESNAWYYGEGRSYLQQLYTDFGVSQPRATFHRLIVTEHRRQASDFDRLTTLYTQALRFNDRQRRNMYFAAASEITAHFGHDAPVWYPINTFYRSWREPIAERLERRPEDVYTQVGDRLRALERLAMFPPAEVVLR